MGREILVINLLFPQKITKENNMGLDQYGQIRNKKIDFNFESELLEVKTDSDLNSNHQLWISFFRRNGDDLAGWLQIEFGLTLKYSLKGCTTDLVPLPEVQLTPTTGRDTVWRFSKSSSQLRIDCNDQEVLSLELSTCTDSGSVWYRGVTEMQFNSGDTASDSYRILSGN